MAAPFLFPIALFRRFDFFLEATAAAALALFLALFLVFLRFIFSDFVFLFALTPAPFVRADITICSD